MHDTARFRALSTLYPVAARSGCTNIPFAAGRAQEDDTILEIGMQPWLASVRPPGSARRKGRKQICSTYRHRATSLLYQVDVWHEFLGDTTTSFSYARGFLPFEADLSETWIEAGLGASLEMDDNASLYGTVNYETTIDSDTDAWGINGKIGLRVNW